MTRLVQSDPFPIFSGMDFPEPVLRRIEQLPYDLEIRRHDGGLMGRALHRAQAISIRNDLSWFSFVCTVLHEVLHLLNGAQDRAFRAKEEEWVRRQTAREMIPDVRLLGNVLAWAHNQMEAADELGVDLYVLRKRLATLHPAELHYLRRRLVADEWGA